MSERKVMVKSESIGEVVLFDRELRLKKTWEKKGMVKPVDFDTLAEAIYLPGVEYMFRQGMLSIANKQDRIDLGLEDEEGYIEPVVVLDDAQKKRYMTVLPLHEFKEAVQKLPKEQVNNLIDYAIEQELMDMDKTNFIKELTGINIIKAIQLKRDAMEV